jgi:hypothetical protein
MASEAPPLRSADAREFTVNPSGSSRSLADRVVSAVDRRWFLALASLLTVEALILLYYGRGLTFYYDEWEFILRDYGGGLHMLFLPHVGNLSVFPIINYKILFHLAGLNHYAVYRIEVIVLHLLGAALIFALSARRIGRVPALLATALILFLGAAWEDLLWAFQVGYMLSIVCGLATWLVLEREDRRGDVAAMLCLTIAIGSSSLGIALTAGIAAELAWRRQWSRGFVVLVPAVLYLVWYLDYGTSQVTAESIRLAPGYAEDLAAAAFGGLVGRALEWGRPLALLGFLALLVRLARPGSISPRLAGLVTAAVALWILTGLARSTIGAPESSRYIYLGAVIVVLIGVELLAGKTIGARAVGTATLLVLLCAWTGLTVMRSGAQGLWETSKTVTAELGALQLASAYAPPNYQPDPRQAPPVTAGPYLHVVRSIGSSPADTPAQIVAAIPSAKAAADSVLLALETPKLVPTTRPDYSLAVSAPQLVAFTSATQTRHAGCIHLSPSSHSPMTAVIALPHDGIVIDDHGLAPVAMSLRRFGETFTATSDKVPASGSMAISMPPDSDSSNIPWLLQLTSSSSLAICTVSG